jgi:peptide deformylase
MTVATATAAEVSKVNAVVALRPSTANVTLPKDVNELFRTLMAGMMHDIPAVEAVGVAAVYTTVDPEEEAAVYVNTTELTPPVEQVNDAVCPPESAEANDAPEGEVNRMVSRFT